MSELPREAQALLALAKDAHDPPDADARDRVRRGVAMMLAAGAGTAVAGKAVAGSALMGQSAAPGALKVGLFASLNTKLAAMTTVAVVVGATAIAVPHSQQHKQAPKALRAPMAQVEAPHAVAAEKTVATETTKATPSPLTRAERAAEQAPPQARTATESSRKARSMVASHKRKQGATPATDLASEMRLLREASDALAANQTGRALVLLKQHRTRFATPALREERDGLSALAQCTLDPIEARDEATRFLARTPGSVLGARIKKACRLPGGSR